MNPAQYKQLMEVMGALEQAAMWAGLRAGLGDQEYYESAKKELTQTRREAYDLLDTIAFGKG